jgi:long-chain acyl-CoA synthetase
MNIASLLSNSAKSFASRVALRGGNEFSVTYAEFAKRVSQVASSIQALSNGQVGARVVIYASNSPQYIEAIWAAWWAGLAVVPVNAKLHPRELDYIVENSGTSICFVDGVRLRSLESEGLVRSSTRTIAFESPDFAALYNGDALPLCEVDENCLAWLFYTSGTTGKPKGAMLTHRNLSAMFLRQLSDLGPITERDSFIHAAPISHASGLLGIAYVAKGACNVVPSSGSFKEDELVELINRDAYSACFLAPTMVNRLVRHPKFLECDLSRLRFVIYGGAPMYLEDLKHAVRIIGARLVQIYGQGETPNTISYLPREHHVGIPGERLDAALSSVGIPRTGIEVRLIDEAGSDVSIGQIGEVLVRSDVTMFGYWNNSAASEAAIRDGWLHTGDMGSFDEFGYLSLKDRAKDVIISGGSNIYPREVEEVVLQHHGVLEASVIGEKSAEWGEEVLAFIVRKPGASVSSSDLDALCLQNIARFKRPKAYCFVDDLPKSHYGKILKTVLREWLRTGLVTPEKSGSAG